MTESQAGITDEVRVWVDGVEVGESAEDFYGIRADTPPIPDRPADNARKTTWAAYIIALGVHPDVADTVDRAEMIALADRLAP